MRLSTPQDHGFFHDHGFFDGHRLFDDSGLHRGWLAGMGAVFLVLGLIGLGWLTLMTVASILFFGALALIGGIIQLLQSFASHGWRNVSAGALLGVIYLSAAILIFSNPVASSLIMTILLACALIALGVVRLVFSLRHRHGRSWAWSAFSGVLSIVIGCLIIVQWPLSGLFMIGLFISFEMIFHGAAAIAMAFDHKAAA